jgi:hypothetical protein
MKAQIGIALLCLLSCSLVGCPGSGDKATTQGETQIKADAPEPQPEPQTPEDTQEEITDTQLAGQPAAGPPATTPCAPTHSKQAKVTPGTYCVCNIGTHEQHKQRKALHLKLNQDVVISPLDYVTNVTLGANNVQMVRSADEIDLTALVTYQHQIVNTPQSEPVTHFVRITPETNPLVLAGTRCDPTKNVLRISFCYKDDVSWSCGPRPDVHNGDTHVEN